MFSFLRCFVFQRVLVVVDVRGSCGVDHCDIYGVGVAAKVYFNVWLATALSVLVLPAFVDAVDDTAVPWLCGDSVSFCII